MSVILIVGGYGVFGGRIVQLLEGEPRLSLIVAGRSASRAAAFCKRRRKAAARLIPAAILDRVDLGRFPVDGAFVPSGVPDRE